MKKKLVTSVFASAALAFGAAGAATLPKKEAAAATIDVKVAQYSFADATNLGKDGSGKGNDLTAVGTPAQWKEGDETGVSFDGSSVLYAAGAGEDKRGNDFADALVAQDFTLSLDFYVDSAMASLSDRLYRAPIFTLWGHMYTGQLDTNIGGEANKRAAALTVDGISDGTAGLRFAWPSSNGSSPDWGPLVSVTADAWHTIVLNWDSVRGEMSATMDGNDYFTDTAKDGSFVSNVARFTLGGYYTDPLNGGKGINGSEDKVAAFVGKIKNVDVTAHELQGNKYNALASYDFKDSENLGKASNPLFDLEKKGDGTLSYDSEKKALYSDTKSALVAKTDKDGYDVMDYMAGKAFTVSTTFMLPKNYADGQKADGRGAIFSLWGLWSGNAYGGGTSNTQSSSLVYDAYDSGADTAHIRFGFLYDFERDGKVNQENGWWSNKETDITTDVFHTIAFSIDENYKVRVALDGADKWEFDISSSQTFKSTNIQFALGGAYGVGGLSTCSACAYYKLLNIYDFAMSKSELIRLSGGSLDAVDAKTIASADDAASEVTVTAEATEEEIIAKAPAVSQVTVRTADNETSQAYAKWTNVVKRGVDTYLQGEIFGANLSNLTGVKAYMPVTVENVQLKNAYVSYAFDDAENLGKSSKGGIFDLAALSSGATAENGVLTTNGAVFGAKRDAAGYDFFDYMNDYTVTLGFLAQRGVEADHQILLTLYGVGPWASAENRANDSACIILNNHGAEAKTAGCRIGFAYETAEGGFTPEWSKYLKEITLGEWHNIALSYAAENNTLTVAIDGEKVCSYELDTAATGNYKNARAGFTVGGMAEYAADGSVTLKQAVNTKIRSLNVYDYAVGEEDLCAASLYGGVLANATVTAAKVTEVASKTIMLEAERKELTAEIALEMMQKSGKGVRVNLSDETTQLPVNVLWTEATENDDGSVSVKGLVIGAYNPDDVQATATVKIKEYSVSFASENVTVKVGNAEAKTAKVAYGGKLTFGVTAAEGYTLKEVKVGGNALTAAADGTYTLENVTADVTVTIVAEKNQSVDPEPTPDPAPDEPDNNGGDQAEEKKGCKGVAGGATAALAAVAGIALILRKKKEN